MSDPTPELTSILSELNSNPPPPPSKTTSLLSIAKRHLLTLNALLPTPTTPPKHLKLARSVLETGALLSIRLHEPDAFTRYFQQLQPFYELRESAYTAGNDGDNQKNDQSQRSKITGLYLLLLLTKGDYAGFHTVLEGLEVEGSANEESMEVEIDGEARDGDQYIQYPIKLERWLMEGSYDRVWGATKREGVPSEEFGEFSEVY
jgi:26S proteasome regulatory subunit N12